ncbi:hypothetical protein [Campylobacter troglodytis]|uniref:hypothetical protein n=1 Tax=Campylobacter troglodytis TaxID=654363 RepID=UPI00115A7D5B|nr:hypothetical protein [Campylobacter troglodytis]TQR61334.1 hypothetical protein DMC01_01820 [Campylobacter troglodytis]
MDDKIMYTLTEKVNELLERYKEVCDENENLRNELVSARAQNEAKNNEIARLEEELKNKNIFSEDMIKKMEAALGK